MTLLLDGWKIKYVLVAHTSLLVWEKERHWRTAGAYLFSILTSYWEKRDCWRCSKAN